MDAMTLLALTAGKAVAQALASGITMNRIRVEAEALDSDIPPEAWEMTNDCIDEEVRKWKKQRADEEIKSGDNT